MEHTRWREVEALLQEVLDVEPAERTAFLRNACHDEGLRRRVEELIAGEEAGELLERPAILTVAPQLGRSFVGQVVGRYRIEAAVGAGGMGEVYRARDEALPRTVALKRLPPEFTADDERVRRFKDEAVAVSRLNHPNIVTIHDVIDNEGVHLIATEFVEGRTLRQMLLDPQTGASARLPIDVALDITTQVAAALEAAHRAGIIHRDIKPENIMVRSDGLVKVLDFGIAKLEAESPLSSHDSAGVVDSTATVPGAVLGTRSYMSPEQAAGGPLDARTDLFSLGLVLCEMFSASRTAAGTVLDDVPRPVAQVVRKLLRTAPGDRYSSATELLEALRTIRRRFDTRHARRMTGFSFLGLLAAVALTAAAARYSVSEVWQERMLRDGHTGAARQAVVSPDGRLIASCGEDGQVIIWDFARRQRISGFRRMANRVAFSPDGRSIVAAGTDGALRVSDLPSQREVAVLRGHTGPIIGLGFSPDGKLVASASETSVILWDMERGRKLREWPLGFSYGDLVFSADGRQLFASTGEVVINLVDGSISKSTVGGTAAAYLPSAGRIGTIDPAGFVSFYRLHLRDDLTSAVLIWTRRAHQDHGRFVAFSPDGHFFASAAEDIVLWDAATGQKIARLEYPAIVWSVAFSPDSRWMISSHADGAVLIWDVLERERVASLDQHSGAVRSVVFAGGGRQILSAGEDRSVTIWDTDSGRKRAVLDRHETRVTGVAVAADGKRFATIDQDGELIVWNAEPRRPALTLSTGRSGYCVAMSGDGRFVAVTRGIYAAADGRLVRRFDWMEWKFGRPYGVAFAPDGRSVAAVTDSGWITLWDIPSGRLREIRLVPHTHQISVSFAPNGKSLVTGEDEGAVRLWSVEALRPLAILGRHAARVKSVAFSPDGATVASSSDDESIALWNVAGRTLRGHIGTHASPVYSVAFSPDGRLLVSGEHDRTVRVYARQRSVWRFPID